MIDRSGDLSALGKAAVLDGEALVVALTRRFRTSVEDATVDAHTFSILKPANSDDLIREEEFEGRAAPMGDVWPSSIISRGSVGDRRSGKNTRRGGAVWVSARWPRRARGSMSLERLLGTRSTYRATCFAIRHYRADPVGLEALAGRPWHFRSRVRIRCAVRERICRTIAGATSRLAGPRRNGADRRSGASRSTGIRRGVR